MNNFPHLSKFEAAVSSGTEWSVASPLWVLLQLRSGIAYACAGRCNEEFVPGGVMAVPPHSPVTVRASQLGEANLRAFALRTSGLVGLLTAAERMGLERQAAQECAPFRQLPAEHRLAQCMNRLFENGHSPGVADRLAFLQGFVEWLGPALSKAGRGGHKPVQDPKARLRGFVHQTPESELAKLELGDLARHLCCCDRHASRLFYELFGCSFRRYITDLRLGKACQLLVEAEHKIIDVALDSGHSSLAQFNYAFKNRFRMSPSQWRARQLGRPPAGGRAPARALVSVGDEARAF